MLSIYLHLVIHVYFVIVKPRVCDVQDEMVEFTQFSKDLERELEYQLEENEKEIKELRQKNMKFNLECDSYKVR